MTIVIAVVATATISLFTVIGAQAGNEVGGAGIALSEVDPVDRPSQQQLGEYSRLADAELPRDQPEADLTSFVNMTTATTKMGLNLALAREVVRGDDWVLYLAPAKDSLCIVLDPRDAPDDGGAMVGCNGNSAASSGGLVLSTVDPETGVSLVAGALPDSADRVSVEASGPWRTLAENENGYLLEGNVTGIGVENGGSRQVLELPGATMDDPSTVGRGEG